MALWWQLQEHLDPLALPAASPFQLVWDARLRKHLPLVAAAEPLGPLDLPQSPGVVVLRSSLSMASE